ncbi:hypothetical protein [Brevundimonas vesicularis]|uniref:hypothetical protein n=1 Tax=Brevundimonas vesicularis TaxID=41276 RepID=UPI00384C7D38
MKRSIPLAAALALVLGSSSIALAQPGPGGGHGNGKGRGDDREGGPGRNGPGRGGQEAREGRHHGPDGRGGPATHIDVRQPPFVGERANGKNRMSDRDIRREIEGRIDSERDRLVYRRGFDRALTDGCPPGLARKNNGCLPPGQARKIVDEREDYARYNYLWRTRADEANYMYRDGYMYRYNTQGGLLGYLPILGGVLSQGNVWPTRYEYQPAPQYFSEYFGLNDRYQYRYADGVLYGVDPQTQGISQIAALLTGQQFNVGQRMPAGYDVYNVPYAYRDRYVDSPQSLYRYNDGYVYQVGPTTQVVQAVIQLLT